ncbi:AGAP011773-PA [Anopheles gambiae str. PEST]|uniref:AGAP011773-PA n=1 Tax=Anopheles gambiae TaxID=7165 RepID=A0NGS2_ANOGA|nr:AGAP011773-PA [Anopheles gambiae str. PEST]
MEQSSSECPIEKLPPEIMHSIFEFLDLESLKSASLTCQRWERIFVNYCTSRLTLCINAEDGKNLDSTEPPTKRLQRATKMLQRTQRVYRNQLVVLDLNLALYSEHMVKDVSDAIAKMNRLQELRAIIFCKQLFSIGRDGCNSYYKLTNPSLHKLAIRGLLPTVIDCPNMRSLELPLCLFEKSIANQIYFRHNEREERYWRVEQVEKLVIMHLIAMDSMDPIEFLGQFLQQMPRLKTLHLDTIGVLEKKLQLISETCTQLEELVLTSLDVDDPHILRHISKLTHLRNIGDFVSIFLAELPKMPALEMLVLEDVFKLPDLHTFLPPLPQLKRLVIYHTKNNLQQYNNTAELAKLVPNVKRIEMSENKYRHEDDFVGNF